MLLAVGHSTAPELQTLADGGRTPLDVQLRRLAQEALEGGVESLGKRPGHSVNCQVGCITESVDI